MNLGELRRLVAAARHWPDDCHVTVSGEPVTRSAVAIHLHASDEPCDPAGQSDHHEPITFVCDPDWPDEKRGGRL